MHVDCTSIANLPMGDSISDDKDRKFVTLPLVCLGMFKGGMKCAFLLVTDFTSQTSSTVFNNLLPLLVPLDYELGGRKLDRAKVFSISIGGPYIQRCWTELGKFTPNMQNYNTLSADSCNFSKEGVVALVNFRVQPHYTEKTSIEGFYSRMIVCNREMLSRPSLPKFDKAVFLDFMARYVEYFNIELYDTLLRTFPVEKYVLRTSLVRRDAELRQSHQRDAERARLLQENKRSILDHRPDGFQQIKTDIITQGPPAKARRLMGAQVMFQQHFTQTQQEPESQETNAFDDARSHFEGREHGRLENHSQNEQGNRSRSGTNGSGNGSESRGERPEYSSGYSQSQKILVQHNGTLQDWNKFSVNKVDFATLARVACHSLSVGTSFTTRCQVHDIRPDARQLFIKPFRRTLKIAPIVIYLTQGSDLVKVELHTEEEKCKLLGIDETEEAIDKIEDLCTILEQLPGTEIEIRLEKRIMTLDFGYERSYWSTSTSLERMKRGYKE